MSMVAPRAIPMRELPYRLSPAERQHVKPLARKLLRALMHGERDQIDAVRGECRSAGYIWGDLFLQVIDLGYRYESAQDAKGLARVKELRADLRAFVNDDAALDDSDLLERENAG